MVKIWTGLLLYGAVLCLRMYNGFNPMKKKESKDNLAVEISFLEGLFKRMPDDLEILKLLGDDYTKSGRWEKGLEIDLELARLQPKDLLIQYNLACSLSLMGRLKESAEALARAILLGYREWEWMQQDPDLENLRNSKEFGFIAALLENRSQEESEDSSSESSKKD